MRNAATIADNTPDFRKKSVRLNAAGVIEEDLQEQIRPLHPPYSCRPFAAHALWHPAHFQTTSRLLNIPELCVMVSIQTQKVWPKHP
jgi:hypothetical protein